jgi:hypothetical protein
MPLSPLGKASATASSSEAVKAPVPTGAPREAAVGEVETAGARVARPVDGGRVAADDEALLAMVLAGGAGGARGDRQRER